MIKNNKTGFINWWSNLKYWKKGLILGGLVWVTFICLAIILYGPKNLSTILLYFLLILVAPFIAMWFITGFLSSLTKNRFVFIGGVIGLIIGLYFDLLLLTQKSINFLWLIRILSYFSGGGDPISRALMFPIMSIFVSSLAGILLGFVIGVIVKRVNKK